MSQPPEHRVTAPQKVKPRITLWPSSFFLIRFIGGHGLIKLHRVQAYDSVIRHLHTALRLPPKSNLLPPPSVSPPFPPSLTPFPPVTTRPLSASTSEFVCLACPRVAFSVRPHTSECCGSSLHLARYSREPPMLSDSKWQCFTFSYGDPAISLLGMYPEEFKTGTWTDTCTTKFPAASSPVAKIHSPSVP